MATRGLLLLLVSAFVLAASASHSKGDCTKTCVAYDRHLCEYEDLKCVDYECVKLKPGICSKTEELCTEYKKVCTDDKLVCVEYKLECVEHKDICKKYVIDDYGKASCYHPESVCVKYDPVCLKKDCFEYDLVCSKKDPQCVAYEKVCEEKKCSKAVAFCVKHKEICSKWETKCVHTHSHGHHKYSGHQKYSSRKFHIVRG